MVIFCFLDGDRLTFLSCIEDDNLRWFITLIPSIMPCIHNLHYWIIRLQFQYLASDCGDGEFTFQQDTGINDWMRM